MAKSLILISKTFPSEFLIVTENGNKVVLKAENYIIRTGRILFIPDLAVEEVSHVFRAAFYS